MKKALNSILSVLLALVMTASIVASEITVTPELPPINNTEITEHKGSEKEPDCFPNYDESWADTEGDEY